MKTAKPLRRLVLALFLAAPLAAGLVACGGEEAAGAGPPTAVAPTQDNAPGTYRMTGSDRYVLDADGTFTREENGETLASGTWEIEGERVVLTFPEGDTMDGIGAGETRSVAMNSRGLVVEPDSEYPRTYGRR